MKRKQLSIAFQTNKTPATYVHLAKYVNHYDFDVVSVYCDAPYQPSYGPLILMAPHIEHARLGPAAVSPFRIHPIDIAANTALLGHIARGGVYVGLARGAWLPEHGIREPSRPIQGIRETVLIIQKLLQGESAGLKGQVFQIEDYVKAPYPLPRRQPPVLIGTWGSKLAALAGEIADEVKVGGCANPLMAPVILSQIQKGERHANRRPESVALVMGAVTVVDEDRQLARNTAKRSLALYLPVVASLDSTVVLESELIDRLEKLVNHGEQEKAGNLISDEVLERFAFAGTPEDLIQQSEALFSSGVTRIEFGTPHGLSPENGIRLIGERVLPALRV
jgi:5,10-methylenetetrahydromethanopterin reductase